MTGLELPAFVVGLTGLEIVFKRGCMIWRTIKDAENFGDDMAEVLCRLEMEFFRFVSWMTAVQRLVKTSSNNIDLPSLVGDDDAHSQPLTTALRESLTSPLVNAAENILRSLVDVQDILDRNDTLRTVQAHVKAAQPQQQLAQFDALVESCRDKRGAFAAQLKRGTSWFKRLRHDATPWRDSDKANLREKLSSMEYWNRSLLDILPDRLRDTLLRQAISAFILDDDLDPDNPPPAAADVKRATAASDDRDGIDNRYLAQTAALLTLHHDASKTADSDAMDITDEVQGGTRSPNPDSLIKFSTATGPDGRPCLLEWFAYPPQADQGVLFDEARSRWAKLAYLLSQDRPSTLLTLDALGFIEDDSSASFALAWSIPRHFDLSIQPSSLYDLFMRAPIVRLVPNNGAPFIPSLPPLERRQKIATSLSRSLYTFMTCRWHHENFDSRNIFFLFKGNLSNDATPSLEIAQPYVGGFGISRPDGPTVTSIGARDERLEDIYLHPDLRLSRQPKFTRAYDIYSFGLLLVEIGHWLPLHKITRSVASDPKTDPPDAFRRRVIQLCESELPCWAGTRYSQVALKCLKVGTDGGLGEDLAGFYEEVVFELTALVRD